jgi:hypothetical protein
MIEFIQNNIGEILNLIGAILIAFSFGRYPHEDTAFTTSDKGDIKYIAYFNYPCLFYVGITMLCLGFLLQLIF